MVDLVPIAGMIFSLLFALIIGGFLLLVPISKRLGRYLELRIDERRAGLTPGAELEELRRVVEGLQAEVARLAERQAWSEKLLERSEKTPLLPGQ